MYMMLKCKTKTNVALSSETSFRLLISTMIKSSTMSLFTKLIMTSSILRIRKQRSIMSFQDK